MPQLFLWVFFCLAVPFTSAGRNNFSYLHFNVRLCNLLDFVCLKLGVFKIHSRITNPIASLFANAKNSANKTQNKNMGNVVDYVGYFSATDDYKPYYNPEVVQSFAHTLSPPGYVGSSSIPIAPPKRGTYQYGKRYFLKLRSRPIFSFHDVRFRLKFIICVRNV